MIASSSSEEKITLYKITQLPEVPNPFHSTDFLSCLFTDCLPAIKVPSTTRQTYNTCISFYVSASPLYKFLSNSNK